MPICLSNEEFDNPLNFANKINLSLIPIISTNYKLFYFFLKVFPKNVL